MLAKCPTAYCSRSLSEGINRYLDSGGDQSSAGQGTAILSSLPPLQDLETRKRTQTIRMLCGLERVGHCLREDKTPRSPHADS